MKLIYEGPHQEVEVPHDEGAGGLITAAHGKVVEIPDAIAKGLLEQGHEHVDKEDGSFALRSHNPQWRKASDKQVAKADEDAAKAGDPS